MNLSYGCSHYLKAEERANELLNTPGLVHICAGWARVPDPNDPGHGMLVKCECVCHAGPAAVVHEPVTPEEEKFL